MPFASIPECLEELKAGRMVVLVDDEDRENEGDLVIAAEKVTPGGDQLHGHARARRRLPRADAGDAATSSTFIRRSSATPPRWARRSR